MITFDERIKEHVPTLAVFEHAGDGDEAMRIQHLMDGIRNEYGSRVNIIRVDATHDQRLRNFYDIKRTPTWILFCKGEELAREVGMKTEENLKEMVKTAISD